MSRCLPISRLLSVSITEVTVKNQKQAQNALRRGIVSGNEVLRPCSITLSKLLPRSPSNRARESLTVLHSGLPAQIVSWKKLPTAVIVSSPHTGSSLLLPPRVWNGERLCASSTLSMPPTRSLNCAASPPDLPRLLVRTYPPESAPLLFRSSILRRRSVKTGFRSSPCLSGRFFPSESIGGMKFRK